MKYIYSFLLLSMCAVWGVDPESPKSPTDTGHRVATPRAPRANRTLFPELMNQRQMYNTDVPRSRRMTSRSLVAAPATGTPRLPAPSLSGVSLFSLPTEESDAQ